MALTQKTIKKLQSMGYRNENLMATVQDRSGRMYPVWVWSTDRNDEVFVRLNGEVVDPEEGATLVW